MKICFCRFILAVAVIVFAWLNVSWGNIALTVLGALLALLALTPVCCCRPKVEAKEPEAKE